MEVKVESYPISMEHMQYFRRGDGSRNNDSMISDLRETSGVLQVRLDYANQAVVFLGTTTSLRSVKLLLNVCVSN